MKHVLVFAASVRAQAIEVLLQRPREEYRSLLLKGLRYPWFLVADHAAEALVALNDKEAPPALRKLVDRSPAPTTVGSLLRGVERAGDSSR